MGSLVKIVSKYHKEWSLQIKSLGSSFMLWLALVKTTVILYDLQRVQCTISSYLNLKTLLRCTSKSSPLHWRRDRCLRMVSNLLRPKTRTWQHRTELKLSPLRPDFFQSSLTFFWEGEISWEGNPPFPETWWSLLHSHFVWWRGWEKALRTSWSNDLALCEQALLSRSTESLAVDDMGLQLPATPANGCTAPVVSPSVRIRKRSMVWGQSLP